MTISKGEVDFYIAIKDACKIIFDIGCREDCPYVRITPNKIFHLFEPNPVFYNIIAERLITNNSENIFINNFGIGNLTEEMYYYPSSQSFMPRPKYFITELEPIKLKIKSFSEYIKENNIEKIDFLKIDTEGWEPDILLDDIEFIKHNVEFVQFEYSSAWLDRKEVISLDYIYNIFCDDFDFYFLFDENHPISCACKNTLTPISKEMVNLADDYMKKNYGFNLVMVKKEGV